MNPVLDQTTTSEDALRVVVDAQIVLSMFLTRRDRPGVTSPKRQLLKLLPVRTFRWLWTPDVISDYERGADAIEADEGSCGGPNLTVSRFISSSRRCNSGRPLLFQ